MRKIYSFGISLYTLAIRVAALFNPKAKKWVQGRKNWEAQLREKIYLNDRWIWFHCSSLGEYEQGRPVLEAMQAEFPHYKYMVTFFSPSGYEVRKNSIQAGYVGYLPADSPANVKKFLDLVRPRAAFFIKYDLWVNYLLGLQERNIPTYLVSALLQPESKFLKSRLAPLYAQAFRSFSHIFTQDQPTADLLQPLTGAERLTVAGDTRFDRAAMLPGNFREIPLIAHFVSGKFCVICGSTWPKDEEIILAVRQELSHLPIQWIIAPHEIHPEHIEQRISRDSDHSLRFSQAENLKATHSLLWIDNVGMLNRLYHYANLTYIGGGFDQSIHNTQEPAVYGRPVAFGPKFERFREAVDMVKAGSAFVIREKEDLKNYITRFFEDREDLQKVSTQNREYMASQAGATHKIMARLPGKW
ncbi:MAG: 3-deoxy-D-manno-octulosonic acid transferase [Bacteroidia bacterium]|nr:3-deoxy-D-manno-octulosonic acid transferase [Bacteroidia bacterium]